MLFVASNVDIDADSSISLLMRGGRCLVRLTMYSVSLGQFAYSSPPTTAELNEVSLEVVVCDTEGKPKETH